VTLLRFALWLLFSLLACAQHATNQPAFETAYNDAKRLQLAPGLKLSVWATEPQFSNSVAFSFDGRGRVFLAESDRWAISVFDITAHTNWLVQDLSFHTVADRAAFLTRQFATNLTFLTKDSELVRVLEDRAGNGRADHSEIIATGFNSVVDGTAAGVLATGTNVYFANIPNLWRLSGPKVISGSVVDDQSSTKRPAADLLKTDPLNTRSLLATGFGVHIGVSGHDLHGLIKGPDGRIYMSFGDRGVCLTNREGVVINLPDTGGVLRCEPDGRDLELFCFGLRNPQELAFDDLGNLWTVDNDTAGADPCRVLHLVEGGDYGWRTSYQHMEGFGPWVQEELWKGGQDGILPPAGTVSQGPSGLAFYPGTGFGDRLKGKFLHCDFPAGVVAFSVKPRGASYEVDTQEKFLWNCWPTDVDFGPDGAAYVLDWVNGWGQPGKGRIYRITPTELDPRHKLLVTEVKRLLAEGMAQRGEKELLNLLGHPDRRVRLEAQWELAGRGANSFKGLLGVAKNSKSQFARLHALWGIGHLARALNSDALAKELHQLLPLLADQNQEVIVQATKTVSEGGLLNALPRITELLNNDDERVRTAATTALEKLYSKAIIERYYPSLLQRLGANIPQLSDSVVVRAPTLNLSFPWPQLRRSTLESDNVDPFRWLAATRCLQGQRSDKGKGRSWLDEASGDSHPRIRALALAARCRIPVGQLDGPVDSLEPFLTDPDPQLVIAAGRAIHDLPIVEGFPALAAFITKIDCPTNLLSRVIDACFRLGTQQHAQMLAGFAAREDAPDWARVLALRALGDWEKPSPLDRVNGLWRPLVNAAHGARNLDTANSKPATAPANPLLERAAQAQSARNLGRAAEIPVLPADLGRSVSYDEAMALRRNPAPAQRAFLRVAGDLMNPFGLNEAGQPAGTREVLPLQIAAVEAAAKLRVREAGTPLYEIFSRAGTVPELRRAILPALAELRSPLTGSAVKLALADPDPRLRTAALPHLDRLEGGDAVTILGGLVSDSVTELRLAQAAFAALGKIPDPPADSVLRDAWQRLLEGKVRPELELDLVSAAASREALQDLVKHRSSPLLSGSPSLETLQDRLVGGDVERGRQIFFGNQSVQCSRCHSVGGAGGTVGPKLDGVGGRNPRTYLLESIVAPNAKIAPGFENTVVTLTDGRTLAGTVKQDANDSLVLEITDGEAGTTSSLSLAKSQISRRERGPSAMPEGLIAQLPAFELRDLVEYLASLK
jgi:quinoprotein glucose dehydrogenase